MAKVDLTKCEEVAKLEFSYLHDQHIHMKELLKLIGGTQYYETHVLPRLTFDRTLPADYLEMPN